MFNRERVYNKNFSEPTPYDVLACLTKSEVKHSDSTEEENFEDFCSDFGYNSDSIKAEKIYKAVCKEWDNVKMLWSDEEIEKLGEVA